MARETRAQREERLAREEAAAAEQQKTLYPARLMAVFERATKTGRFELSVVNGAFEVTRRDTVTAPLRFTLAYSFANDDALNELEWDVERFEREEAEAERRYQVRQTALAKLSKEERELLGL